MGLWNPALHIYVEPPTKEHSVTFWRTESSATRSQSLKSRIVQRDGEEILLRMRM
jgi:hypothetical protein